MSTVLVRQLTPEQYLEIERRAEFKSEFFQGEMFAMAGASRSHIRIAVNLTAGLGQRLLNGPCEVFNNDMRVRVSKTGLYTYPDLSIACHKPQFMDDKFDTLLTPKVLFEILSESTERYDRITKSSHYREIESLDAYVLVSQKEPRVEVYQRLPDGHWSLSDIQGLTGSLALDSLGITIPLSEVYLRVEFPSSSSAKRV